jgi:hypothetical protein
MSCKPIFFMCTRFGIHILLSIQMEIIKGTTPVLLYFLVRNSEYSIWQSYCTAFKCQVLQGKEKQMTNVNNLCQNLYFTITQQQSPVTLHQVASAIHQATSQFIQRCLTEELWGPRDCSAVTLQISVWYVC